MILTLLIIYSVLNTIVSTVSIIVAVRYGKRCLQFDELFSLLEDDLFTNNNYLTKLRKTDLFINSPEVIQMHQNVKIMQERQAEFLMRTLESRGKSVRS